jgi:hypothetical protein
MFIDIIKHSVRVVMKNTGELAYMNYPRDIEGTVIGIMVDNKWDRKKAESGDLRSLFDVNFSAANFYIRWDNDTRGSYYLTRLHIRDFGTLPGLESIWDEGVFRVDNRPYHALNPMTVDREIRRMGNSMPAFKTSSNYDKYRSIGKQYFTTSTIKQSEERPSRAKKIAMDFEAIPLSSSDEESSLSEIDDLFDEFTTKVNEEYETTYGGKVSTANKNNYVNYGNITWETVSYNS